MVFAILRMSPAIILALFWMERIRCAVASFSRSHAGLAHCHLTNDPEFSLAINTRI